MSQSHKVVKYIFSSPKLDTIWILEKSTLLACIVLENNTTDSCLKYWKMFDSLIKIIALIVDSNARKMLRSVQHSFNKCVRLTIRNRVKLYSVARAIANSIWTQYHVRVKLYVFDILVGLIDKFTFFSRSNT